MMNASTFWERLTDRPRALIHEALDHADELGLDIVIDDAVDLWHLLPVGQRGPKPE